MARSPVASGSKRSTTPIVVSDDSDEDKPVGRKLVKRGGKRKSYAVFPDSDDEEDEQLPNKKGKGRASATPTRPTKKAKQSPSDDDDNEYDQPESDGVNSNFDYTALEAEDDGSVANDLPSSEPAEEDAPGTGKNINRGPTPDENCESIGGRWGETEWFTDKDGERKKRRKSGVKLIAEELQRAANKVDLDGTCSALLKQSCLDPWLNLVCFVWQIWTSCTRTRR